MGLYNNVKYKCTCPVCNHIVDDFQTKCGDCFFDTVNPEDVDHFYSGCDVCNTWIDVIRDEETGKLEMKTQPDLNEVKHLTKKDMLKYIDAKLPENYHLREYCRYKLMPLKGER